MKALIVLVIGIIIGYYFGMKDVSSISEAIDVVGSGLQYLADKIGEFND